MANQKDQRIQAIEQLLLTGLEGLFGTVVQAAEPILAEEALARVEAQIDGRQDAIAENDKAHGWSPSHVGDPKNDFPASPQEKRVDNTLFVFAHQLGGTLSDKLFRDRFSRVVTPLVMARITDASTSEEIAAATCGTLKDLLASAVAKVTGVAA